MPLGVVESAGSSALVLTIVKDLEKFRKNGHYEQGNTRKVVKSKADLRTPELAHLYLVAVVQMRGAAVDKFTDDDVCSHCESPLSESYDSNGADRVDVYVRVNQSTLGKSGYICPCCATLLMEESEAGTLKDHHEEPDDDERDIANYV